MRGVDILIAFLLTSEPEHRWEFAEIGAALHVGSATAHRAVGRLERSGLVDASSRQVRRLALEEFVCHGLRYVFPAELGAPSLGVPTAHSAPVMASRVASRSSEVIVWPSELGQARGASLTPLHPSAAAVALERPLLYELLALADVLRLGRAREVQIARESLSRRLRPAATT